MSAINDALRRASNAAKTTPSSPILPPMPVEPARSEPPPPPVAEVPSPIIEAPRAAVAAPPPLLRPQPAKKGSKFPVVLIILFILGVGGAGGFYFWQKQQSALTKNDSRTETEEEITDNDRLAALFGDEKAATKIAGADIPSNPASSPSSAGRASQSAAASPVPVTVTVAQPAAAPVARPPVRFPPLRLQSIFYRPASPSVIINGKTLFVTDEINGVTVADIQASSVTLVMSGQTNILTLR
jgi:hypothetical protein